MSTREDFEAWAKGVDLPLELDEHECFVDARVGIAANAYQAATSRQEAKIKALRDSLNWALSNISEEPYEWSSEEDADAHNAESSGAQHPTRMPGYRAGTNTGD